MLDRGVQVLHCVQFQRQVVFELGFDVLADLDGADVGHVGSPVKKQDPVHEFFGVHHLFDGFLAIVLRQPEVAPVFVHFGVKEILVDGRKLGLQGDPEILQYLVVSAHLTILA